EVSPSEHVAEVFAKRIGDYLEKARTEHRYDRLYLVAPPKFLGVLRRKLDRDVEKLVMGELPKDLSGLRIQDLQEQLAEIVQGNVRAP
ncbi:MAG TPA: host attachment protein, partial [Burkholderiales bacterium]|nr:host attachment protein [Burkholderiales bacterium]